MNERKLSLACLGATVVGFFLGFFAVFLLFEYRHEAGFVFPISIGLWTAILITGLVVRGKLI